MTKEKCVLCEDGFAVETTTEEHGRHMKCLNGCEGYYTGEQSTERDLERKREAPSSLLRRHH